MPSSPDLTELAALHRVFLKYLAADDSAEQKRWAEDILMHPASQRRLQTALGVVMRGWARRLDLRADVIQEAMLRLEERFLLRTLTYQDRGPEAFGGWLWSMWFNSCRDAWRHCQPLWLKRLNVQVMAQRAWLLIEDRPAPATALLVERIVRIVVEGVDQSFRDVLLDWLAGLSLRQSAARRRMSPGKVRRLRKRLWTQLEALRPTLDLEDGL